MNRVSVKAAVLTSVLLTGVSLILLRVTYVVIELPLVQALFISLLVPLLIIALQPGRRWLKVAEATITRISRHRILSVSTVGTLAFLVSAGLSIISGIPQPAVDDEFSYLLAGDTFAHGRIANPTHPMWVHFESIHIIQQPTYASKYPPGQGLALGVGQVVAGQPIVGVWLSTALACAAICWMLFAWVPARWALLGGVLIVLHPIVLGWSQSYWGGAVAMGGGAVVIGAFRRIVRHPRAWDAFLMGVGMAILANSRPYEGLVLSLLLTIALVAWMLGKKGPSLRFSLRCIVLPLFAVLLLTAGAIGFYNKRVTGSLFQMPYMLHEATYAVAPNFLFQGIRSAPSYRHKELREVHVDFMVPIYQRQRSLTGLLLGAVDKFLILGFACSWLLIPPLWLLVEPSILKRDWWMRFTLVVGGIFVAALLLEIWVFPHYAAPATGLAVVFSLNTMRYLRSRRHGGAIGQLVLRATVALSVISFAISCSRSFQSEHNGWNYQRAAMIAALKKNGQSNLVMVRHRANKPVHHWVYNEADIDAAKVVWASEMDPAQDRKLLEYFKDRRVWLLDADAESPALVPYSTD
jgi:hypothetical protein